MFIPAYGEEPSLVFLASVWWFGVLFVPPHGVRYIDVRCPPPWVVALVIATVITCLIIYHALIGIITSSRMASSIVVLLMTASIWMVLVVRVLQKKIKLALHYLRMGFVGGRLWRDQRDLPSRGPRRRWSLSRSCVRSYSLGRELS